MYPAVSLVISEPDQAVSQTDVQGRTRCSIEHASVRDHGLHAPDFAEVVVRGTQPIEGCRFDQLCQRIHLLQPGPGRLEITALVNPGEQFAGSYFDVAEAQPSAFAQLLDLAANRLLGLRFIRERGGAREDQRHHELPFQESQHSPELPLSSMGGAHPADPAG